MQKLANLGLHVNRTVFWTVVGAIAVCWNPGSARAQNECKVLFDAADKLTATPHHGYQTSTVQAKGAKQETGEDIFVGGAIYVLIHGKWRKSPTTVEQRKNMERENRQNARNVSCRYLRDEAVNGEAAKVFQAHSETPELKADSVVWIAKGTGLILRQEEDVDSGEGDRSHVSVRYEYRNVSAPVISH